MAYERSPAATASFEPAVRGAPELPGRGARSAARLGRAGASRPSRVRADRAHCVNRSRRIGRSRHPHRVGRARRTSGARRTIGAPADPVVLGPGGVRPAARSTGNAAGRRPPPYSAPAEGCSAAARDHRRGTRRRPRPGHGHRGGTEAAPKELHGRSHHHRRTPLRRLGPRRPQGLDAGHQRWRSGLVDSGRRQQRPTRCP